MKVTVQGLTPRAVARLTKRRPQTNSKLASNGSRRCVGASFTTCWGPVVPGVRRQLESKYGIYTLHPLVLWSIQPVKFGAYLEAFRDLERLQQRVLHVLNALPDEVQQDFLRDGKFSVALDNYHPGRGSRVFMAPPGPSGDGSRSVVLKPLLAECSAEFAYYVIAHEFAHAFLRNGPWGDVTDVELAADGLAASWGFTRPVDTPWSQRSNNGSR